MKNYIIRFFAICLALGFAAGFAFPQNDTISAAAGDRYVISAKAGGVNYVEGGVAVARKSGTSGHLIKGDSLEVGDRVSTASDGKAEILLNPGSFLRLGGNSVFEFNTTSLDDLELKLERGSAILEVFAADEFKVTVKTPNGVYALIKSGIFRIDIPGSQERLRVWKGMATAGAAHEVKPGREALGSGKSDVTVAKFDRDEKDSLDVWSKARSKELARLTSGLSRNDLRTSLMRGFLGGQWGFLNSFGLWIFSPYMNGYCFLPFGYGWSSPYGHGYGMGMYWWWNNQFPMTMPTTTGGGTSTGGGNTTGGGTPQVTVPVLTGKSLIPPFIRMEQQNSNSDGFVGGGIGKGSYSDASSSSSPSYSRPDSSSSSSSSSSGSSSPPPASTGARDATGTKP